MLGLFLIGRPVTRVTSHFSEHGRQAPAEVIGRTERTKTLRTRRGDFERTIYTVEVRFEDEELGFRRSARVSEWVDEDTYENAGQSNELEVVYLPKSDQLDDAPKVLLQATVDASFFRKVGWMLSGDLRDIALGLIITLMGALVVLVGTLMLRSRSSAQP